MVAVTNSTAAFFRRAQGGMDALRAEAEGLQQQVSTGARLQRASDDPVASARLRALARAERLAGVDSANAARADEELSAASARLEDVSTALIRARELAVQAASDATSPTMRAAIATEIAQLREGVLASANALSLSGRTLFGGEQPGPAYVLDAAGNAGYVGGPASGKLELGEGVAVERGLTGPAVFAFDHAGVPTDVFAFLRTLEAGLRTGADPAQFARDAIPGLDSAITTIGQGQTILGVRLGWVETVQGVQLQRAGDRAEEAGDLGGIDLASAITRMQQVLTVLEASQASFVRLASLSLFNRL